jgi:hypothetical protein
MSGARLDARIAGSGFRTALGPDWGLSAGPGGAFVFLFPFLDFRLGHGQHAVNQLGEPVVFRLGFRLRFRFHAEHHTPQLPQDTPKTFFNKTGKDKIQLYPSSFFLALAFSSRRCAAFRSSSKVSTASMFIASPKDTLASSKSRRTVLQSGSTMEVTGSLLARPSILETRSWDALHWSALARNSASAALASSASRSAIALICFCSSPLMAQRYTGSGGKSSCFWGCGWGRGRGRGGSWDEAGAKARV